MSDQTIVAVYDTPAHAELAVQDLLAAGVPHEAVERHAQEGSMGGASAVPTARTEGQGFWSSLFGGEPDHDTAVYDRSVQSGGTLVSVKVPDPHVTRVIDILESHRPIDIDERAASYGLAAAPATATAGRIGTAGSAADVGESLRLSEESLSVGKRVVNRGTTRIRRFVVETPVEEQVSLRDEHVTIERRPVTDGRPVADSFSEKVLEVTEMAEEAVVGKTARVREEVTVHKDAAERVETVRDTVRREDLEVVKVPGETTTTTTGTQTSKL